jgi:hypothetical protein
MILNSTMVMAPSRQSIRAGIYHPQELLDAEPPVAVGISARQRVACLHLGLFQAHRCQQTLEELTAAVSGARNQGRPAADARCCNSAS